MLSCAQCGAECQLVRYPSPEEVGHPVPWGPGYRALYFEGEDDVDLCSPECSLAYTTEKRARGSLRR